MGLSRGRMRRLWLHQPKAQRIADGMEPAFETESVALLGTIQPLEGTTTARLYGEESAEMSLLLTEGKKVWGSRWRRRENAGSASRHRRNAGRHISRRF